MRGILLLGVRSKSRSAHYLGQRIRRDAAPFPSATLREQKFFSRCSADDANGRSSSMEPERGHRPSHLQASSPGVFCERRRTALKSGKIIPYPPAFRVEFRITTRRTFCTWRIDRKRNFLGTIFLRRARLRAGGRLLKTSLHSVSPDCPDKKLSGRWIRLRKAHESLVRKLRTTSINRSRGTSFAASGRKISPQPGKNSEGEDHRNRSYTNRSGRRLVRPSTNRRPPRAVGALLLEATSESRPTRVAKITGIGLCRT